MIFRTRHAALLKLGREHLRRLHLQPIGPGRTFGCGYLGGAAQAEARLAAEEAIR
ncbi:hypothetical protein [Spirillospora sp. CA-128828]|uniref:hypothetical protein n=1 Tax=Spirillospora sp. CA-128828 TaxID=3240033 RepID=UPI003D8ADFC9